MKAERNRFIPDQDFGGAIGPSIKDHIRSNLSYGRRLLNLDGANSSIDWGRRKIQRALQALVLGTTLFTGNAIVNAETPVVDGQSASSALVDTGSSRTSYIDSISKQSIFNSPEAEQFIFEQIRYKGLEEVAAIHGKTDRYAGDPNNWEFIPSEFGFAARLKEKPIDQFADTNTVIDLDPNTVAEGYQWLADPTAPGGYREQRIVVGPGQGKIPVRGILVRRDGFPNDVYKFVLTKRTTDTVAENATNGTNFTVIGIDGFQGKGDIHDPQGFKVLPMGTLIDAARRFGGIASDYVWVEGEVGFAVRFKEDRLRLVFLTTNTVVQGTQPLWSPNSEREQRVVADGNGQIGLYLTNGTFRLVEGTDVAYKHFFGRESADTIVENFQNGTDIIVVGVNGFRGGEK